MRIFGKIPVTLNRSEAAPTPVLSLIYFSLLGGLILSIHPRSALQEVNNHE